MYRTVVQARKGAAGVTQMSWSPNSAYLVYETGQTVGALKTLDVGANVARTIMKISLETVAGSPGHQTARFWPLPSRQPAPQWGRRVEYSLSRQTGRDCANSILGDPTTHARLLVSREKLRRSGPPAVSRSATPGYMDEATIPRALFWPQMSGSRGLRETR